MPLTDSQAWLHGTPVTPSNIFTSTSSDYSDNELNFGTPSTGSTTPWLPEFPSSYEKAYVLPPEVVGDGGVEMGLHLVISATVVAGSMTAAVVNVVSAATSSATAIIASRTLTLAQVAQIGSHYFIPVAMTAVLQYLRANFIGTTAACSSGTGFAWFGPKTGGEQ